MFVRSFVSSTEDAFMLPVKFIFDSLEVNLVFGVANDFLSNLLNLFFLRFFSNT
jgi:hypothetical protein